MSKLNLEIKGIDAIIKKLKTYGEHAENIVEIHTKATALEIAADAKRLAPVDTGKLRQSIGTQKVEKLTYRIFAGVKYAPYMEFGTGGLVEVPKELKALAIKFKGKGVKKIDLKPQPFLYPALVLNRQYYKETLLKELKKIQG